MPPARPPLPSVDNPITDLTDQRVVQILSTEHWSLLSARGLAYNEAFTRGGMFLTFLSMSFVALALFSTAMSFGDDFLIVVAVVLAFDFIIGLLTYGRIGGANVDDLRAVHGMARIRHAYTQMAPVSHAVLHDRHPRRPPWRHARLWRAVLRPLRRLRLRAHDLGRDDRAHHVHGRRGLHRGGGAPHRCIRGLGAGRRASLALG